MKSLPNKKKRSKKKIVAIKRASDFKDLFEICSIINPETKCPRSDIYGCSEGNRKSNRWKKQSFVDLQGYGKYEGCPIEPFASNPYLQSILFSNFTELSNIPLNPEKIKDLQFHAFSVWRDDNYRIEKDKINKMKKENDMKKFKYKTV